jgi:hypothetical protein
MAHISKRKGFSKPTNKKQIIANKKKNINPTCLLTSQLNNQKIMEIKSAKNQKVWVGESICKTEPNHW